MHQPNLLTTSDKLAFTHGRWHASLNRPDPLRVLMMPTEVPVDQEAVGMRTASIDRLVFATT